MSELSARWWRRDAAVALLGLLLVLAWDASGLDLPLARLAGDAHGFALRNDWLMQHVLHDGAALVAQGVFVLLGLNELWPLPLVGNMPRAARLRWWLIALACALVISLLKHRSQISCPWSLAEFGGSAHKMSHLSFDAWFGAGDGGPGRCFPAGHVSNAFALVVGTFALRPVLMRASRRWLAAVCVLGLVLATAQLLRGAHLASHSLWTAWICWSLGALLWHATSQLRWRQGRLDKA